MRLDIEPEFSVLGWCAKGCGSRSWAIDSANCGLLSMGQALCGNSPITLVVRAALGWPSW